MFSVEFTPEAADDLISFRKFDQQTLVAEIETKLKHEPMTETRQRKRLRPNLFRRSESYASRTFASFMTLRVTRAAMPSESSR